MNMKLIRLNELTGLSSTTIWRLEKNNNFPLRKRIAKRCVAWLAEDVEQWILSKRSIEPEQNKKAE